MLMMFSGCEKSAGTSHQDNSCKRNFACISKTVESGPFVYWELFLFAIK